ncbi:MAG: hypothetical protein AAFO89_15220, partial [Planctomycetota bacterium]
MIRGAAWCELACFGGCNEHFELNTVAFYSTDALECNDTGSKPEPILLDSNSRSPRWRDDHDPRHQPRRGGPARRRHRTRPDLPHRPDQLEQPDRQPHTFGNTWNNYLPGTFLSGLFDTDGNVSGGGDFFTGLGFGGTTPIGTSLGMGEGLANPDVNFLGELAVPEATEDHHFRFADTLGYEISNLDPNATYTIRMFGSRLDGFNLLTNDYSIEDASGTRTERITIGGPNTGSDGASFANDFEIVEFTGVTPRVDDNNVRITADFVDGTFSVISIIEIETEGGQPARLCADQNGDGAVTPGDFNA